MFFNPHIDSNAYPILEIGPGALPYPASDVWLDYMFSDEERIAQSGNSVPAVGKPLVLYNTPAFPFKDKSFKYSIASHVIEHIAWENLPKFISEIVRVSEAGYIELPMWPYEFFNDVNEHVSTGDVIFNQLILYKKSFRHGRDFFTKKLLDISQCFRNYIEMEKNLFFCKLEWRENIDFKLVDNDYPCGSTPEDICNRLEQLYLRVKATNNKNEINSSILDTVSDSVQSMSLKAKLKHMLRNTKLVGEDDMAIEKRLNYNLSDLMQCTKCGGDISHHYSCNNCGNAYSISGNVYKPNS